ncbi:hypothetical protein ECKG_00502, partial [Escherichia coli TA206]
LLPQHQTKPGRYATYRLHLVASGHQVRTHLPRVG